MSRVITNIAVTIAGCGMLVGSGLLLDPLQLHDTVRGRVLAGIGGSLDSPETVRAALRGDPDFGALVECLCRRTLATVRNPVHGEDALQEAFLKTWKGRPELFLKSHDEVVRYLREATRRNMLTLLRRSTPSRRLKRSAEVDLDAFAAAAEPDMLAESTVRELLEQLVERLDADERAVLTQRLAGAHSDRQVAAALGCSRYAAGQATEGIRRKMDRLLAGDGGSAA